MSQVTVLILGGGQGKRLYPLTSYRSKPAVPIGGKYRLVDIPISNSINSGLHRIFVLTQFNSTSLHRHIHRTYPYELLNETRVELLAAEQTLSNTDWFQGTADAVRKHMQHYHLDSTDTVLILSGDHLYKMDYTDILKFHESNNADVTIATVPVPKREVRHFGIMQVQEDGRLTSFLEKPQPSEETASFVMPETIKNIFQVKSQKELYLASMGIYVFKASILKRVLEGRDADFGKEVIPKAIKNFNVYGYVFNGYWRDIGTIEAFFDANIELTKDSPDFSFSSPGTRFITRARFLPPSKIASVAMKNVVLSEGCTIEGAEIEDSVVGLRSQIRSGTIIRKSIVMGNDVYEIEKPKGSEIALGIGENCEIENCIIDKNVRIGKGVKIKNQVGAKDKDSLLYCIRDGIVIIPKGAVIPNGTVI